MEQKILKCMVVDDEPHAIEILELYIDKTPFLELSFKEQQPWEAVNILKANDLDLLFLDIQMEGLTGLQVLDVLDSYPSVILTTAYEEYALKGYEYEVSDYLLKPYSYDRFLKAVNKVYSKHTTSNTSEPKPVQQPETPKAVSSNHLFIKGDAKNKFHRLAYSDIKYVEGMKNYVTFHCENEKITTLYTMSALEKELPDSQFIRIHKSFIINLNHIKLVDGNCVYIDRKMLPIGASHKNEFLSRIKNT